MDLHQIAWLLTYFIVPGMWIIHGMEERENNERLLLLIFLTIFFFACFISGYP
jgi:hypothetical protein